jgi:hypothetical protein
MMADKKGSNTGKVQGEGDYEATRHYDEKLEKFVKDKKSEIPTMAKDAEKALEGPEGDALRKAEEIGKSKARK